MEKKLWIQHKIVSAEVLHYRIKAWKLKGEKVVFTNGVFDLLHAGHIQYLIEAAQLGNRLVIGLNTDASVKRLKGETRPLQPEQDRAEILASLVFVDAVCLFDEDTPIALIERLKPDVLTKGGDYTKENIVGAKEVEASGGLVMVLPFLEGKSSTGLIEKLKNL